MWSVRPLASLWMRPFLFQFSRNVKTKKKVLCRTHYSLPTTPPAPFKYGWLLLHQTKGRIGNEKNLNKCKIRVAHNPDHIPFKVSKICFEPLVKFIFKN